MVTYIFVGLVFISRAVTLDGGLLTRGISSSICRFILIFVVLFGFNLPAAAQNNKQTGERGQIFTIRQGLATPGFSAAYRKTFQPYLGLEWVASPVLEAPSREVVIRDTVRLRVFFACRPHACGSEKLSFIFDPISGKGWGAISVRSEIEGDGPLDSEIEGVINRSLEGQK